MLSLSISVFGRLVWTTGQNVSKSMCFHAKIALRRTPDSGRRKRGRPRETWRTIEGEMKTTGKTGKELEKAAMDSEQWKSLVSASCVT